ncbi:pilus assembly protein PilP [Archangium sp.]|uniref:pilus assembly protein PilP n=1 Tax=Archangium sp. TaxID=1872627 RepID=UPI00389A7B33
MKPSLAALAFGVLFSGCSARAPEPAPAPVSARPLAVAPAPAHEPIARSDPIATYSYNPIGRRDPFRFEIAPTPEPVSLEGCDETLEPLCRYTLDELKLTGIVSGMGNPVAVLESPRGKGYSVYRGSRIGKHGGVVKQVLRDAVVVVESWPDAQGLARREETVLRMRADAPLELGER